jgi:hypothetical protein
MKKALAAFAIVATLAIVAGTSHAAVVATSTGSWANTALNLSVVGSDDWLLVYNGNEKAGGTIIQGRSGVFMTPANGNNYSYGYGSSWTYNDGVSPTSQSGSNGKYNSSVGNDVLTVSLAPSKTYDIRMYFTDYASGTNQLVVSSSTLSLTGTLSTSVAVANNAAKYFETVVSTGAGESGNLLLTWTAVPQWQGYQAVTVSVTPEPATMSLLGLGVLGFIRRK